MPYCFGLDDEKKEFTENQLATGSVRYMIDNLDTAIEFYTKSTELASVRHLIGHACAAVEVYTTHFGFAVDVTPGRARAMMAAAVGLISVVIGGLALARSAGRLGTGSGRGGAMLALVLGLIGMVL